MVSRTCRLVFCLHLFPNMLSFHDVSSSAVHRCCSFIICELQQILGKYSEVVSPCPSHIFWIQLYFFYTGSHPTLESSPYSTIKAVRHFPFSKITVTPPPPLLNLYFILLATLTNGCFKMAKRKLCVVTFKLYSSIF